MYFFLVRPQQQRMKQHRALMMDLDVGDDVVTSAGIYGRITEIDAETVFLQINDDVELKLTKESVVGLVSYEDEDDAEHDDEIEDDLVDDE